MNAIIAISEVKWRAGQFARSSFERHAEKELQRRLGISESEAERILSGGASGPSLHKMLLVFGRSFFEFAYQGIPAPLRPALSDRHLDDMQNKVDGRLEAVRQTILGVRCETVSDLASSDPCGPTHDLEPVPRRCSETPEGDIAPKVVAAIGDAGHDE